MHPEQKLFPCRCVAAALAHRRSVVQKRGGKQYALWVMPGKSVAALLCLAVLYQMQQP